VDPLGHLAVDPVELGDLVVAGDGKGRDAEC